VLLLFRKLEGVVTALALGGLALKSFLRAFRLFCTFHLPFCSLLFSATIA